MDVNDDHGILSAEMMIIKIILNIITRNIGCDSLSRLSVDITCYGTERERERDKKSKGCDLFLEAIVT